MTITQAAVLLLAAALAGAINSVAGGGTLVTFPSLLWAGVIEKLANATSTVALWPGSMGGAWGYRHEVAKTDRALLLLIVPSVLGGFMGAGVLLFTPPE